MLVGLHFCHKDAHQALRLMQWIGELGGAKNHELLLSYNKKVAAQAQPVIDEATRHFGKVQPYPPYTEDERGWPYSANHAWLEMAKFVRIRIGKPWLYMEPDCVPLKVGWLDTIEAELPAVEKAGKCFMGAEITTPEHRMSGIGVYPAGITRFSRRLSAMENVNQAFDSFLATDFLPNVYFTTLIQSIWNTVPRDPNTHPRFPDKASLAQIDPRAVLFHRVKSNELIDLLSKQKGGDAPLTKTFVPIPTANGAATSEPEAAPRIVHHPRRTQNIVPKSVPSREKQLEEENRLLKQRLSLALGHHELQAQKTDIAVSLIIDEKQKRINERMARVRAAKAAKRAAMVTA